MKELQFRDLVNESIENRKALNLVKSSPYFTDKSLQTHDTEERQAFSFASGFHIYGDLRLNLKLSAPNNKSNAQEYLNILQEYASLADVCGKLVGAEILEVQGEKIHFFMETPWSLESLEKLMSFCIAFSNSIYSKLASNLDDDAWNGFAMAADYGKSILLCTGQKASDSIISLGPSANRPAKKLPKTKSKNLIIPKGLFSGKIGDNEWVQVDLIDFKLPIRRMTILESNIANEFDKTLETRNTGTTKEVFVATEALLEAGGSIEDPTIVTGLFMRADLDGFTKRVEEAFAENSNEAIKNLAKEFSKIANLTDLYAKDLKDRNVICLPWSGDCANILMLPRVEEDYESIRTYLPVQSAKKWHQLKDDGINQVLKGNKWAVSIAGGDDKEGSSGYVLVADIETSGRNFQVASGWSVGRSLDALDTGKVNGGETAIHTVDYNVLDSHYKRYFRELDSQFMISTKLAHADSTEDAISELGKVRTEKIKQHGKDFSIPKPKPYWKE